MLSTKGAPDAPALGGYEFHITVLMSFKRGQVTKEDVERLLLFLAELDVQLVAPPSYGAVFYLAEAHRLTGYDASYPGSGFTPRYGDSHVHKVCAVRHESGRSPF